MRMNTFEFRECRTMLLRIISIILEHDSNLLHLIKNYPKLQDLLLFGILENSSDEKNLSTLLKRLLETSSHSSLELYQIIIDIFFTKLWSRALTSQNRNENFWSFIREAYVSVCNLVREVSSQADTMKDAMHDESHGVQKDNRLAVLTDIQNRIHKIFLNLVETVQKFTPQTREQELKFAEMLITLRTFLYSSQGFVRMVGLTKGLFEELVYNCIFTSLRDENKEPKCKSQDSIQAALYLLTVLITDREMLLEFCKFTSGLHLEGRWRKFGYQSWRIGRVKELNNVDYNGLKNLGCSKNNLITFLLY